MTTLSAVVDWVGVPEVLAQAFYEAVGATGQEHPRTLGVVSCDEMNEGIKELQVNNKPLTIVQKGLVRTVHRVCCLVAGTAAPAEETKELKDQINEVMKTVETLTQDVPTETPSSKTALGNPQVHLKQVISQASEGAVPLVSQSDLLKHWDCFKKIYGRVPKPHEECTGDQLTGVNALLQRDMVPYVDFGVWGPNHHRLLKRRRNTGLQLHAGGVLRTMELAGPPDLHAWLECYRLLTTALVGFEVVGLGPMFDYGRLISTYSERYGALTWPLLYQCDVRCRLEHMERLRRVLERKFVDATARGQAPSVPIDQARPWDSVWTAACEDFGFWHVQFEKPALIILTKSGRLSDIITGEAPVEHGAQSSAHPQVQPEAKRRKMRPTSDTRAHRVSNGVFTHNRSGIALCADFQTGACQNGRGSTCSRNPSLSHQCNKCLAERHGGSTCNLTPKENVAKGAGKGRIKGKGKRQS